MRNQSKIILWSAMLLAILISGFSFAFASEISGSLSSTPQTYSGQGNISGNVSSPSTQTSGGGGSYGGGGGGGAIVMPTSGYFSGEPVNYNMGAVNLGGTAQLANNQPTSVQTNNFVPRPKPLYPKLLAQADATDTELLETATSSTTTDDFQDDFDLASLTPTTTNMDTTVPGQFDFFGISAWFWLVVGVLLALIVSVLYMQS